jgi:hypothetical protein
MAASGVVQDTGRYREPSIHHALPGLNRFADSGKQRGSRQQEEARRCCKNESVAARKIGRHAAVAAATHGFPSTHPVRQEA